MLVNGPQAEEPQPRTSTVTIQRVESAKRVKSTDSQEAVKGSLKATRFNAASPTGFHMGIDKEWKTWAVLQLLQTGSMHP